MYKFNTIILFMSDMDKNKCIIILYFTQTDEQLSYDLSSMPNIEPINKMIENFKADGEITFNKSLIRQYNIQEGSKNIIENLVKIMENDYRGITDDNIKEIIRLADFYLIDIDYSKVNTKVIDTLVSNLTSDDLSTMSLLFKNDIIANKYITTDFLKGLNDKKLCKTLTKICPNLYFDEEYNYTFVKKETSWVWLSKDILGIILPSLKNDKKYISDTEIGYNFISKLWGTYENAKIAICSMELLGKNDYPLKCILFNKNHIMKEIKFTPDYKNQDGVMLVNKKTILFTIDALLCTSICVVYKTNEKVKN